MSKEEKAVSCANTNASIVDYFKLELPWEGTNFRTFIVCDFREHKSMFYCSTGETTSNARHFAGTYFQTAGILDEKREFPLVTHDERFSLQKYSRESGHVVKMGDVNGKYYIRPWQARFIFSMLVEIENLSPTTSISDLIYIITSFWEFTDFQVSAHIGSSFWESTGNLRWWILNHNYDETEKDFFLVQEHPFSVCYENGVNFEKPPRTIYKEESTSKINELIENGIIYPLTDEGSLRTAYPVEVDEDTKAYNILFTEMIVEKIIKTVIDVYKPDEGKISLAFECLIKYYKQQPVLSRSSSTQKKINKIIAILTKELTPQEDEDTQPPEGFVVEDDQPPGGGTLRKRNRKNKKSRKTKKRRKTRKTRKNKKRKTIYKQHN